MFRGLLLPPVFVFLPSENSFPLALKCSLSHSPSLKSSPHLFSMRLPLLLSTPSHCFWPSTAIKIEASKIVHSTLLCYKYKQGHPRLGTTQYLLILSFQNQVEHSNSLSDYLFTKPPSSETQGLLRRHVFIQQILPKILYTPGSVSSTVGSIRQENTRKP